MRYLLLICLMPSFLHSQIIIDIGNKEFGDIDKNVYYKNFEKKSKVFIQQWNSNVFSQWDSKINNAGSLSIVSYANDTRLITSNISGGICFYDLIKGSLLRTIPFQEIEQFILNSSAKNKNSFLSNLSISKNEKYLIFETLEINKKTDKYIDFFALDISNIENKSSKVKLTSLYAIEDIEEIDESKILNTNLKIQQQNVVQKIQQNIKSDKSTEIIYKDDGAYFVSDNNVFLKHVKLANSFVGNRALTFFSDNLKSFSGYRGTNVNYEPLINISKVDNCNLNKLLTNKNGSFLLFKTSFGSDYNAKLVSIDSLVNNHEILFEKSKFKIQNYFNSKIINDKSKLIEINEDKLYIKEHYGKFVYTNDWLDQNIKGASGVGLWNNSYSWKYFKSIKKINKLRLHKPILVKNQKYEIKLFGLKANKFQIYDIIYPKDLKFVKPVNESDLKTDVLLSKEVDLFKLLPKNENSTVVLSHVNPKIIGKTTCEICLGTTYAPDKVYYGRILTYYYDPITRQKVKCIHCAGKGTFNLVSGGEHIERIIKFSDWNLNDFKSCNGRQFVLSYSSTKTIYIKETRSETGTTTKKSGEKNLNYKFIVDYNGKIIDSGYDIDYNSIDCKYKPIIN